ncbi:syntaxin-6-like isoform X2 [Portunus trituberculatus]|uniref:syntaxin-6-like isoform X2 n=1 Tax=Portunus trituberculatus TaxID=210409 RepID=UPI001E1CD507|nr:syntaxin-6-like isoform X2 [Portunus trituberculatus]
MAAVAVRRVPSRYAPGGTPARAAALARNKSVRKSFKEVNAFRYSNFIDLLYFSSRNEVCKALNKTRGLYQRWGELQQQEEGGVVVVATSREELDWTNTELRNALRSIEWDLEDLEETIGIVEKNPRKFKIDGGELSSRRTFIENTKEEVKSMKERLNLTKKDRDVTARQPVDDSSPLKMPQVVTHGATRYSRLVNEADSPNSEFVERTMAQQQMIMSQQDEHLDQIASSMGTLKNMSRQIGQEVDEQAVMLDDFGHEMENTQSKMENTLSKVAKVMHLSSDRRQWAAIGALSGVLAVIVILFIVL